MLLADAVHLITERPTTLIAVSEALADKVGEKACPIDARIDPVDCPACAPCAMCVSFYLVSGLFGETAVEE